MRPQRSDHQDLARPQPQAAGPDTVVAAPVPDHGHLNLIVEVPLQAARPPAEPVRAFPQPAVTSVVVSEVIAHLGRSQAEPDREICPTGRGAMPARDDCGRPARRRELSRRPPTEDTGGIQGLIARRSRFRSSRAVKRTDRFTVTRQPLHSNRLANAPGRGLRRSEWPRGERLCEGSLRTWHYFLGTLKTC